jgi:hypothetical protein
MVKNKWDRDQDYGNLMKGLIEVGVNQEMRNAQNQGPTAPVSNFNQNFTSPASMQFSGTPEGTTQGVDPNTGFQSSFAPGANPYMKAMGGSYLPKHQTHGIVAPSPQGAQSPMPNQNPYKQYGTYKPLNEQEKRWVDAERLKKGSPDNKWLNPKFSGFWDAVSDPNEGAMEWKSRGAVMNMLAPDLAMSDPRRHRAIQNVIPGYGGGSEDSMWSSIRDAAQMPQYMLNEFFTGYYEDPGETYMRYVNNEDNWGGVAPFIMSMGTDPWILATPGQLAKGAKVMGKTAAMLPFDIAKDIGVTAEQAAVLVKKYGPAVIENAVKGAKYIGKKGTQAYKYIDDIAKKIFTNKVLQEVAPRAQAGALKLNPWTEDTDPFSNRNFKANESTEASRMFTGQTIPMPSSTIQQPVQPRPNQLPSNTNNQDINNMTLEELQAITGMRQYGGDAPLPMAADGQEVPLMMQKYWTPEQIAQARNRQAVLQGNQWAADIANPFSNLFGNSSDPQAAADAIEQGCFPGMDCFPTEAATTGSTAGTTGAGKSKGTKGAGKTETPTTGTTTTTTPTTTTQSGPRKGNYEGTEGSEGTGYYDPNYYNRGYNYGNYENYGYNPGRTKTKMWVVDPETGKRRKIYKHKTDGRGGYGGYSGGRRGYPRVIRNQYDFYQNPIFTQQGALQPQPPAPGTVVNPETGTTPGVALGADASMAAVPLAFTDPIAAAQQRPTPPMDAGMGVLAQVPSPYAPGYGPWSPDPNAEYDANGVSHSPNAVRELSPRDQRQLARLNKAAGRTPSGNTQGMGIFSGRRRAENPERTARVEERFERNLARDEARGIWDKKDKGNAYGGQPNYFEPGGEFELSSDAWMQGTGLFGDTNTPNTGNAPYAMTDQGQKTLGLETKQKFSGQGDDFAQYAPLLPGAVGMFGNIAGEMLYGDQRKLDAQAQALKSASNVFTPTQFMQRGSEGVINTGEQVDTTFAQNPGNNQGMFGSPDYFGRYGGQPQYANGGEYYLDEDEIAQLRAGGAVIEYL